MSAQEFLKEHGIPNMPTQETKTFKIYKLMEKENKVPNTTKPGMIDEPVLCGVIIIFTHNLITAELNSFFWLKEYGWCFDWYENNDDKENDCKTYGIFPQDYIDQNEDYEQKIIAFLETQPKKAMDDIPVVKLFEWLNAT